MLRKRTVTPYLVIEARQIRTVVGDLVVSEKGQGGCSYYSKDSGSPGPRLKALHHIEGPILDDAEAEEYEG